jgi:hypothetical protein
MIKLNSLYTIPFLTTLSSLPIAADSTPTAVLWRNGSAEATSVSITTTSNVGVYHASFTTNIAWSQDDRLWIIVIATIDGNVYKNIIWDSFSESEGTIIEGLSEWDAVTNTSLYSVFQSNPSFITERSSDDDNDLTFSWPNSTDTITAEVSIDNAAYVATTGTISYLRQEGTKHYFVLSYNALDRPSEEGTARYKFSSVNHTMYATLRVTQPYTDELAAAVALMNSKLSSSTISIISPLNIDGTSLNVIQGDDYLTIDGRNILFSGDIADQWVDLTGATVIIGVCGTSINKECVVISATGMQQISLELTSSDTTVPQGTYNYDVQATLSNGSIITLFRGKFTCSKSYT